MITLKMKKLLLSLFIVLAGGSAYAQRTQDVVHLHNGSIIRGEVIEHVPGADVKVRTADGSVFVYKSSEIEKIEKENVKADPKAGGHRGLDFTIDAGWHLATKGEGNTVSAENSYAIGNGNRVAALSYGPKQVLVVVGMNKVCPTVESAMARARSTAAPININRFAGSDTPCYKTGICAHCATTNSVCAQLLRTRVCRPAGRIKVILVGENLGY